MSTSKPYHHGNLRAALLASTADVIAERGVEALSLREVSHRAGVSHTAAYNHFRDKADLVRAFVSDAFREFGGSLRRAAASTRDPLEALLRVGIAYVLFAYRRPAEFRVMFRPELCERETSEDPDPNVRASYRVLEVAIEGALHAGKIAGDPATLALACWSSAHGLSALIVDGPDPTLGRSAKSVEAFARATLGILVKGMRV